MIMPKIEEYYTSDVEKAQLKFKIDVYDLLSLETDL